MQYVSKQEFIKRFEEYKKLILVGAVFVYPTDTIYGIGCNALDNDAVEKIRKIKQNFENPFSVIVPSIGWVKTNLEYSKNFDDWLNRLPGPYTLILNNKNNECVCRATILDRASVGIRIPDNWFSDIVAKLNIPIITTSVNAHNKQPITDLKLIPESIKNKVEFIVDDGIISGNPSTLVNLTTNPIKIIKRN